MNENTGLTAAVKTGGKRLTTLGVLTVILGILAMLAPGLTGLSIALLLGICVTAAGILRMIWAFQAGSFGKGLFVFALGALTLVCGIALLANPLFASGVLTIMLAIYFVVDGLFEIAGGFSVRPLPGWGWLLFGGIVSLLLGMMIATQYPLSGAWAMGTLLGIKLFLVGLIMINGGTAVRAAATS